MSRQSAKPLVPGLYESPVTRSLENALRDIEAGRLELSDLDPARSPLVEFLVELTLPHQATQLFESFAIPTKTSSYGLRT